jgi:acyl-CoA dehydrogenase
MFLDLTAWVMSAELSWWVLVLLVPLMLAYHGANRWLWLSLAPATVVSSWLFAPFSWGVDLSLAVLYGLPLVLLGTPQIRRQILSSPVLRLYRNSMPEISRTEREALEAGGTWFEAELFGGKPRWKQLLDTPPVVLSEAERAFLDGPVETLCGMLDDHRINQQDHDLTPETWDYLKQQGFFGMVIPPQYGGKGFSQYGHAQVVMKIATRSIAGALTVMIPNSVGPAKLLLRYGTEAQRDHYLPRLARGEDIPCFALTGLEAGSDASGIPDYGVVERGEFDGREVLGIRLNFDKRYITLAPVATVLALAFKLRDPDGLLGDRAELGISLALVPTDLPGVEKGARHDPMGVAFLNGPVRGDEVFIPVDNLVGGAEFAGQGWRMLMECLTDGRAISLPALSTGSCKLAARVAGAYAQVREQFRVPIAEFEGIQEALARIAGNTYVLDSARLVTLAALDAGERSSVIASIMKYNTTERCRQVIQDALEVRSGAGVNLGPRNPLGEYHKFGPISVTVEGANILTRSLMTFGQGAMRCHPYLIRELELIGMDHDEALPRFDQILIAHVGHGVRNAVRSLLLGLTGGRLNFTPAGSGPLSPEIRRLNRLASGFAFMTDVLLLYLRGTLKRRERISARMADAFSQLYLGACVVKRFRDRGRCPEELDLARWGLRDAIWRCQNALVEVTDNLPRWLGLPLRFWVFPYGRSVRRPDDALETQIAVNLSAPSAHRELLTAGMYLPSAEDDALSILERALALKLAGRGAMRKLVAARKLKLVAGDSLSEQIESAQIAGAIDAEEAELLQQADRFRRQALSVDSTEMDS